SYAAVLRTAAYAKSEGLRGSDDAEALLDRRQHAGRAAAHVDGRQQLVRDPRRDGGERLARLTAGRGEREGHAGVVGRADRGLERHLTDQGRAQLVGEQPPA